MLLEITRVLFISALLVYNFTSQATAITCSDPKMCALEIMENKLNLPSGDQGSKEKLTHYEQLINLYKKASLPALEDFKQWRTGRCFHYGYQNVSDGGLLAANTVNDNGPLFPPHGSRRMFIEIASNLPTFFDRLSKTAEIRLVELLKNSTELVTIMGRFENAWGSHTRTNSRYEGIRHWTVRKIDMDGYEYYIGLSKMLFNFENLPEGHITRACYFFKPVEISG